MCNAAAYGLKRLFPFGILLGLVLITTGFDCIGEEQPGPFDPSDKPLAEFLELTAADLEACPGILSQQAVPEVTFRDLAQSQYQAFQELKKAKATEQYVDTVKIYDELLDVFWETVTIPIDMITGGVIDAYGADALKGLWQIKKSLSILKPATVTMELSELFVAILEVKQDQAFLANQTAMYLHYVSGELPPGTYDRQNFTLAPAFDERIHEDVWNTYAVADFGGQSYLFVPGYQVTHPANPEKFSSALVKWLTKEAWGLAHANYLLQQDREKLREQILLACRKGPVAATSAATPSPTRPPSAPSPVATIVRETPAPTPIPTAEPATTPAEETPTPTLTQVPTTTPSPTPTPTPARTPMACPAPSGCLAFVSSRDDNSEIYVMNADGSGQTRLTNNPALDMAPAWSPDGTKIAFSSDRDGNFNIYVMNADGSGQTGLTNSTDYEADPAWSPDGTKIAFWGTGGIYVMNADGSMVTRLAAALYAYDFGAPAWSPDGRKIAFAQAGQRILVMNIDGSDLKVLVEDRPLYVAGHPTWSPDGTKIAFYYAVIGGGGSPGIYVVDANGAEPPKLVKPDGLEPAWSLDGTRIAFVRGHPVLDVDSDIFLMNPDGSAETRLTDSPAGDWDPAWSP
jgi:Tol biopolymer transport system component